MLRTGIAKIQTGNLKFIHVIEIPPYEEFITKTSTLMNQHIPRNNPFFPILDHELKQTTNLINNIKINRTKRSLNFIGTAWKWVAGNPDHDDYTIMVDKINNVLENNNNQVLINKAYIERINKLTNVTNEILNVIRKDKTFENELVLSLLYKTKLIKEEIMNSIYAIELGKENIVSSNILSKSEIDIIMTNLNKNKVNVLFKNIEEALEFAEVKVAINVSTLLYIISIPNTEDVIYEKLIVKPLIKNKKYVNKIMQENILKRNNSLFGIINKCKTINDISLCKQSNIIDLSNDICISNLIEGKNATCKRTNSQHIPSIEEITPGTILLNNFDGNIDFNNNSQSLNGTYLIKFSNVTLKIKNQQYIAEEISEIHALPPLLHPLSDDTEIEEILSLQLMKELHMNNTKHINKIQAEKEVYQWVNYSFFVLIFFIMLIVRKTHLKNKRAPETRIAPIFIPPKTDPTSLTYPRITEHPSIYNLPYF